MNEPNTTGASEADKDAFKALCAERDLLLSENAALREEPKQLEQWMREHGVRTMHQPHIDMAAEDYAPWQAMVRAEYRCGVTEALACAALAEALNVEFPFTVTRPTLSFMENDKRKIEALAAELARLREENVELKEKLAAIGEMAVVDWDDEVVGAVDAALKGKEPITYKDRLRALFVEIPAELSTLRATNAGLVEQAGNLLSILEAHEVDSLDCDRRGEKYRDCLSNQIRRLEAALDAAKGGESRG